MNPNTIPALNAAALSEKCRSALNASRTLLAALLDTLPAEKLATLDNAFGAGARVGLTLTIDSSGKEHVELVAVEVEGGRRTLATVQ